MSTVDASTCRSFFWYCRKAFALVIVGAMTFWLGWLAYVSWQNVTIQSLQIRTKDRASNRSDGAAAEEENAPLIVGTDGTKSRAVLPFSPGMELLFSATTAGGKIPSRGAGDGPAWIVQAGDGKENRMEQGFPCRGSSIRFYPSGAGDYHVYCYTAPVLRSGVEALHSRNAEVVDESMSPYCRAVLVTLLMGSEATTSSLQPLPEERDLRTTSSDASDPAEQREDMTVFVPVSDKEPLANIRGPLPDLRPFIDSREFSNLDFEQIQDLSRRYGMRLLLILRDSAGYRDGRQTLVCDLSSGAIERMALDEANRRHGYFAVPWEQINADAQTSIYTLLGQVPWQELDNRGLLLGDAIEHAVADAKAEGKWDGSSTDTVILAQFKVSTQKGQVVLHVDFLDSPKP